MLVTAFKSNQKLSKAICYSSSLESIYNSVLSNNLNKKEIFQDELMPELLTLPKASSMKEEIMLADTIYYLPNDILVKVDRSAMSVGLETRAPFLDSEIAKIAWEMSIEMKIKREWFKTSSKWPLRKILYKYIPKELINRPKTGFAMPIGKWICNEPLRDWAETLLSSKTIKEQGFLNNEEIQRIWRIHKSGKADYTSSIWTVLMWQAWLNEWG